MDRLVARRRHPGCEGVASQGMGSNAGCRSADGFECHPPGLPAKPMGQDTGKSKESYNIRWEGVRLDYVLGILASSLTPAADFDIHFAGRTRVIPRKYAEHNGGLQMR